MEESVKNNEICDFNLRKIRKMQKRCKQIIEKDFFIAKTFKRKKPKKKRKGRKRGGALIRAGAHIRANRIYGIFAVVL